MKILQVEDCWLRQLRKGDWRERAGERGIKKDPKESLECTLKLAKVLVLVRAKYRHQSYAKTQGGNEVTNDHCRNVPEDLSDAEQDWSNPWVHFQVENEFEEGHSRGYSVNTRTDVDSVLTTSMMHAAIDPCKNLKQVKLFVMSEWSD